MNTRNSETHAHTHTPIHPMLTSVARWTTPIESPRKRHAVEFPGERLELERKNLVRERE